MGLSNKKRAALRVRNKMVVSQSTKIGQIRDLNRRLDNLAIDPHTGNMIIAPIHPKTEEKK